MVVKEILSFVTSVPPLRHSDCYISPSGLTSPAYCLRSQPNTHQRATYALGPPQRIKRNLTLSSVLFTRSSLSQLIKRNLTLSSVLLTLSSLSQLIKRNLTLSSVLLTRSSLSQLIKRNLTLSSVLLTLSACSSISNAT